MASPRNTDSQRREDPAGRPVGGRVDGWRLEVVDSSAMVALGGQGGAVGWLVTGESGAPIAVPDATYRRSARTVAVLTWGGTPPPMHPLVGDVTANARLGVLDVAAAGVRLEHPVYQLQAPEVPPGRYDVWFAAFAADALRFDGDRTGDLDEDDDSDRDGCLAVVTIWLHLRPSGDATPCPTVLGAGGGAQLTAYLDEHGVVLADPEAVDRILAERRDEIAEHDGLLAAIAATYLGEDLIDAGAFFPVWNMRPWTYRFAGPVDRAVLCPLGRPVHAPVELAASEFAAGIRVISGNCLRGADRVDWSRWPTVRPDAARTGGGCLRIRPLVVAGPEVIDVEHHAGIVATFWLEWGSDQPETANSAGYPLIGHDPLSSVAAEPVVQRVLRAAPVVAGPDGAYPSR